MRLGCRGNSGAGHISIPFVEESFDSGDMLIINALILTPPSFGVTKMSKKQLGIDNKRGKMSSSWLLGRVRRFQKTQLCVQWFTEVCTSDYSKLTESQRLLNKLQGQPALRPGGTGCLC